MEGGPRILGQRHGDLAVLARLGDEHARVQLHDAEELPELRHAVELRSQRLEFAAVLGQADGDGAHEGDQLPRVAAVRLAGAVREVFDAAMRVRAGQGDEVRPRQLNLLGVARRRRVLLGVVLVILVVAALGGLAGPSNSDRLLRDAVQQLEELFSAVGSPRRVLGHRRVEVLGLVDHDGGVAAVVRHGGAKALHGEAGDDGGGGEHVLSLFELAADEVEPSRLVGSRVRVDAKKPVWELAEADAAGALPRLKGDAILSGGKRPAHHPARDEVRVAL